MIGDLDLKKKNAYQKSSQEKEGFGRSKYMPSDDLWLCHKLLSAFGAQTALSPLRLSSNVLLLRAEVLLSTSQALLFVITVRNNQF